MALDKKPCEMPAVRGKLDCYDHKEKKCYGFLIWGCKWSSARPIIALSKCPWRDMVVEGLAKKGVNL